MTRLARRRVGSAAGSLDALAAAGKAVTRLGFTAANVEAAVGAPAASVTPLDAPLYDDRISGEVREPLATLIRLFLLGERVEAPAVRRSLDGAAAVLERAGLVVMAGETATARWQLVPHGGLLLAAEADIGADDRDRVLGVSPSSLKLARLTPRRPISTALDLGTGCGVQALLATAHAERVAAVDVNPRAVTLARLNAGLNDLPLHVAQSDWFSAVHERDLDLIVANLPYTLGPERGSLYDRVPPYAANALLRQVLGGAGSRLAEGGIAVVACAWTPPSADEWVRPVVDWLAELRCDAILFRHGLHDARAYASANARHAAAPARAAALRAWLDSLADAKVEWIATGVVALRRSTHARAWITAFEDVSFPGRRGGSMVERMFEAGGVLARTVGDDIVRTPLAPDPALRVSPLPRPLAAPTRGRLYELDVAGGAGVRIQVDAPTLAAVESLRESPVLAGGAAGHRYEALSPHVLEVLRHLLAAGLLVPAGLEHVTR